MLMRSKSEVVEELNTVNTYKINGTRTLKIKFQQLVSNLEWEGTKDFLYSISFLLRLDVTAFRLVAKTSRSPPSLKDPSQCFFEKP